ncbi:MAG: dihydrolipoyl dehydrogenase [Bacteroidales bacterium]|nr:dihydrolipoyl dehydrogenase [Bacteroidales bacterium]
MEYDVIIIGAGPAGYVAAIRAGQVGLKTALIEKKHIGGMCLNWGCIPSKAVIESGKLYRRILNDAQAFGVAGIEKEKIYFDWKQARDRANQIVKKLTSGVAYLLKKNGVEVINGEARITGQNSVTVENRSLTARNIIIATGSYHEPLKAKLPAEKVVELDRFFNLDELPQNVVVVGESSIAVEMAQFFALIDRKVALLVPGERIMPMADEYLAKWMLSKLKKDKVEVIFNAAQMADDSYFEGNSLLVGEYRLPCDVVINAKLRKGVIPPMDIALEIKEGFIVTNEYFQTSYDNIFAVGDVNGQSMFAHVGSAQGYHTINFIKGVKEVLDPARYPLNMYSDPEVAQIGKTEAQLKEEGIDYKVSEFPLSANGKAMTEGSTESFVRILSEKKYGQVLGVQIISHNATDMIAEAAAFLTIEATVYDVAQTIHAHPTLSEVFMEAGFAAVDKAIHL